MEDIDHSKHSRPAESARWSSYVMKYIRAMVFGLVCLSGGCATAEPINPVNHINKTAPARSNKTAHPQPEGGEQEDIRKEYDDLDDPCITKPLDDPDTCILA